MPADKKIRWVRVQDAMVVAAALLLVGAHVTTQAIQWKLADLYAVKDHAADVVRASEANPLLASFVHVEKAALIYGVLVVPAMVFTIYWLTRRRGDNDFSFYVALLFLSTAFIDITNDLGVLAGLMLR